MRTYQSPQGPMQMLATVLFLVGLALAAIVNPPWIGIAVMLTGIVLSLSMLFAQWRSKEY
jgi:hypothetical protein